MSDYCCTCTLVALGKGRPAMCYDCQELHIIALEAQVEELRELVERTCGDGCHCMDENNERCALAALLGKGEV